MDVVKCPSCGEENPSKFRLCGFCGTPLAVALPPSEVRKTVTILFADLKGSTALGERIDPEALHEIKNRYFASMAAVLEHHGGRIEKYIGDAIMAVFGLPKVREDDAIRAVRAASGMQAALGELNEELEHRYGVSLANRTGVNTGEVVATADPTADQRLADGDAVNVAARLEQAAPPMEVLIGEVTWELVRDHVVVERVEDLTLKGKSEPVPAFRLVGIREAPERPDEHLAPLVGRETELVSLRAAFTAAGTDACCKLVTIIGEPGVGKSRLISDFARGLRSEATVLRGRCLPYGDGITFWPIIEIVREAAGIEPDDGTEAALARLGALTEGAVDAGGIVERVAAAIGLTDAQLPVSELFWGIRKLVEQIAASRPLVLIVDDVQSAEPTLLDLLAHLVDAIVGRHVLVLASARNEMEARHADWLERPEISTIRLAPLTAEDSARLVDRMLGDAGLDPAIVAQVVAAAEGNPLFVEQMVSMLIDRGHVELRDGRWPAAGGVDRIDVPPTIHALLAARLDDLSREERAVIEPAAVIGLSFPRPAVEQLVPDPVRPTLGGHLVTLDRKQLVRPQDEGDPEDEIYRFHHILIRDTTYQSLLKRARASLHERFVDWAEPVNRERGRETEFEEILGYHLEQAYRYRTELGPVDAEARALAKRAATKLASAGRRAFARSDMPAAGRLIGRAIDLLDEEEPERLELIAELGEALMEQGKFEAAAEALGAGLATARRGGVPRLIARLELARLAVDLFTSETTGGAAQAIADSERAVATFAAAADEAGLARAYRLLMVLQMMGGEWDEAAAAAERAIEHATRAGDARLIARGAGGYAQASFRGSLAVTEALARSEGMLELVRGDRKAEAIIFGEMAQMKAMQGEFDAARDLYRTGQALLTDLGPSVTANSWSIEVFRVEMLAGDPEAAAAYLRRDMEALEAMGERYFRSTVAAYLAEALVELANDEQADRFAGVAAELADEDDAYSQTVWRLARARVLARRGRFDEADVLATQGCAIASTTVDLILQADAFVERATVLGMSGRRSEAAALLTSAAELYEQKGDIVSLERVRARVKAGVA